MGVGEREREREFVGKERQTDIHRETDEERCLREIERERRVGKRKTNYVKKVKYKERVNEKKENVWREMNGREIG